MAQKKGGKGKPTQGRPRSSSSGAKKAREASASRQRMKARILALEGRISVVESFLLDARKE